MLDVECLIHKKLDNLFQPRPHLVAFETTQNVTFLIFVVWGTAIRVELAKSMVDCRKICRTIFDALHWEYRYASAIMAAAASVEVQF